jgi:hypothetical protein
MAKPLTKRPAKRLLDRQVSLLAYLTSGAAIFGGDAEGPAGPTLAGFDLRLLQLEARYSHEKRMEKIAGVFSRTLELLGDEQAQVIRTFAERCPSDSIGRIENARQFYDFLTGVWRFRPPRLRYLADVAAYELAFAEVRNFGSAVVDAAVPQGTQLHSGSIRRHPGVALRRCDHDVQPIFDSAGPYPAPIERETFLAFALSHQASGVGVFRLNPEFFAMLYALSDWTPRSAFGDAEEADAMIRQLMSDGLLEAAP